MSHEKPTNNILKAIRSHIHHARERAAYNNRPDVKRTKFRWRANKRKQEMLNDTK